MINYDWICNFLGRDPALADRLLSDNLTRQDVLQIISEIQKQNLSWSSQDIDKAWTKKHHIKNEDLANQARQGQHLRQIVRRGQRQK